MNRRDRIPYVEACRRSRLSQERLLASDLSAQPRALRLWIACNSLLTGYSKSSDRVHVLTLARAADMSASRCSPLLRRFDELGVFTWRKDKHSRAPGLLALPPWVEPEKKAPRQKCWQCGSTSLAPKLYLGEDTGLLECGGCGTLNEPETAHA